MPKILDAIGKDKINRFTLSFKDAEMEKSYLEENNKRIHRLSQINNTIGIIIILTSYIILEIVLQSGLIPFWTFIIILIILCFFSLWIAYSPPGPRLTQIVIMVTLLSGVWYSAYHHFITVVTVSTSIEIGILTILVLMFAPPTLLPLRFAYSIPIYILILLVSVVILFVSKSVNPDRFVLIWQSFTLVSVISLSGLYQKEAASRINFYQQCSINEYSDLLKKMFGRYLSTEVMNTLIKNPSALELGGEKRELTIMLTDLRGFVALTERLKPEKVVEMLNAYFEVMVDLVLKYNGTINEIIGDALLVIFGAPQEMPDRAEKAIACAIDMQNAMANVNAENRNNGLPELAMGIGLNEAEVIVGNIGSSKRSKYTVVGSGVNLASRIESYTVGGQILISESVRQKAGDKLRIDNQMEVMPKGADNPLKLFEVGGISGDYNLMLLNKDYEMAILTQKIPFQYKILDEKQVGKAGLKAFIKKLSKAGAEVVSEEPFERLSNLKINLAEVDDDLGSKDLYAKVIEKIGENFYILRFTSVPAEIASYFQAFRRHLVQGEGSSF